MIWYTTFMGEEGFGDEDHDPRALKGPAVEFNKDPKKFLEKLESSDAASLVNTAIQLEAERLNLEDHIEYTDSWRTNIATTTTLRDISMRLAVQKLTPIKKE